MSGNIFLLGDDGKLQELKEEPYDSEALLQQLLAQYPNLLAGDQMEPKEPRRWLLITREAPVPGDEGGSGRWSLDNLFLDQEGVPTLVEVKRRSDTRIRREVVGQMLDYAANALQFWPVDRIQTLYEARCKQEGLDPQLVMQEILEDTQVQDTFWETVKTNLQAGRIRMVFVADEIPRELRVVVEFLNTQMDPAEVLAVEVHQFVGQGLRTLVPRLIGKSVVAEQKKAASLDKRQWDEASFMAELHKLKGGRAVEGAQHILAWVRSRGLREWWGQGKKDGSCVPILDHNGVTYFTISIWTMGTLEVQFQLMVRRPVFDSAEKRLEYVRRLNSVPGIKIPEDAITRRPSIPLAKFADPKVLKEFTAALDWYLEEITRG